jgi:hypothetical protein
MMDGEREHRVEVWGGWRLFPVIVYQKSKTVWVTIGQYAGERIEQKGPSEGSALKRWKERAIFHRKL